MAADTALAVLAKAPVAGLAKTRLIPVLGAHAAAILHERLLEHAVATAVDAAIGPVILWCTPQVSHAAFQDLATRHPITLKRQPDGGLGDRMLGALAAANDPTIVIGADCPGLTAAHLRDAAAAFDTADVVLVGAEDGGYVLIGTRTPQPALFTDMAWGEPNVLAETRRRIAALSLRAHELAALWDVDTPADLDRLAREHPALAL
jgi:rSAM/selenodomain-associated transferase 1